MHIPLNHYNPGICPRVSKQRTISPSLWSRPPFPVHTLSSPVCRTQSSIPSSPGFCVRRRCSWTWLRRRCGTDKGCGCCKPRGKDELLAFPASEIRFCQGSRCDAGAGKRKKTNCLPPYCRRPRSRRPRPLHTRTYARTCCVLTCCAWSSTRRGRMERSLWWANGRGHWWRMHVYFHPGCSQYVENLAQVVNQPSALGSLPVLGVYNVVSQMEVTPSVRKWPQQVRSDFRRE